MAFCQTNVFDKEDALNEWSTSGDTIVPYVSPKCENVLLDSKRKKKGNY
ncbi:MAG: hypothetical protein PUC66_04500 [Erysipelotrichaceae bacterium]|nr:hypothetical protein [Erysipelotrichaceae bacterium]